MAQGQLRLKETVFSMFEPDSLLPVQYFETQRRKTPLEPEKMLLWAILQDAVDYYRKYLAEPNGKPDGKFSEVESWIMDSDRDWFCSFDNVCETLGLEPQYLRNGLIDLKDSRRLEARSP